MASQRAGQEQGGDDDAQVVGGGHQGRQDELAPGVEQRRGDAREPEEDHGRQDDAHHADGLLPDLRREAHAQQGDQLRGQGDGQRHHDHQRQGGQVDDRAAHAVQVLGAVVGVLGEDGDEGRGDGAADEEVVDHGRHRGGGHEGVGDAGGAEEAGDDLLPDDAQEPAGHVAQGDDDGGVCDAQG